ncbi:MAG: hypothetical protein M1837_002297 [Sclerophora amabilis]|nr:MAG: hypothetical protein M1837_002297 [Sclerophora amabilis]
MDKLKLLMGNDELPIWPKPNEPAAALDLEQAASRSNSLPSMPLPESDTSKDAEHHKEDIEPVFEVLSGNETGSRNMETQEGVKTSASLASNQSIPLSRDACTPTVFSGETAEERMADTFSPFRQRGQLTSPGQSFCPILAVAKYPYRHINKEGQDEVAQAFFVEGRFWERDWDIYYLHPPFFLSPKPLLLVPSFQVQGFLNAINTALKTNLVFPYQSEQLGFLLKFTNDNTPLPRYLGLSKSRMEFQKLEKRVPQESFQLKDEPPQLLRPSDRSLAAFRKKMERAIDATKNKSKASKAKKREERLQKQQGWRRQIKRVQRYLGLRQRLQDLPVMDVPQPVTTTDSWTDVRRMEEAATAAHTIADAQNHPHVEVSSPAPFPQESSVIFIAVDVESFERDHNLITEIGIATLDTLDLANLAPGEGGANWMPHIRGRHFRIQEYSHLKNKDFVDGCADKYEFGESEWISIKEAPQIIASCFRPPFSRPAIDADTEAANSASNGQQKRSIVLVGHDLPSDLTYLHSLGYSPLTLPNLLETLDTAHMYRALKRESQPRSLGTILYEVGLMGWNLHNAGNDAVYTLQVMLAIPFADLALKARGKKDKEEEKWKRVRSAIEGAVDRAREEGEGWSSGSEASDGGVAIPSLDAEMPKTIPKEQMPMEMGVIVPQQEQTWEAETSAADTSANS